MQNVGDKASLHNCGARSALCRETPYCPVNAALLPSTTENAALRKLCENCCRQLPSSVPVDTSAMERQQVVQSGLYTPRCTPRARARCPAESLARWADKRMNF